MSRWSIYRNNGNAPLLIAVCDSLEYHDEWMGDCYITVTVKNDHAIDFHLGDYVLYRNEFFYINYDPNVIKKAKTIRDNNNVIKGLYGEGFVYENIKLYSDGSKLTTIGFKDYVLNWNSASNQNAYSSLATFSFFAASIDDLADRLQANLNRVDNGGWAVYTPNYIRSSQRLSSAQMGSFYSYYTGEESHGEEDINIDVDKQSCRDVLKFAYEKFGLAYYIKGKNIVIGGKDLKVGQIFRYGKNNGLSEIERSSDEGQELVTKVYAYGSDKNLPPNYYANIGKKIKFTVAHKTQREYIMNNPQLVIWIRASFTPASALYAAFRPTFSPTITCNGRTISAHVSGDTFTYGDEKEDPTLDHDTTYMYFYMSSSDPDALNFWNRVRAGDSIYVTGININKVPSQYIEVSQQYPSLLAINRLMLPGFPYTSLHDFVSDANNGLSSLLTKYNFSRDSKDPWIESKNVSEAGVLEGTVVYDGQQQKEIFPSIENTNYNFVAEGSYVQDNGYISDGGTFTIKLGVYQNVGLNWKKVFDERISGDTMVISMRDGKCVGRDFEVTKVEENATYQINGSSYLAYELTLQRVEDGEGRWLPYENCQIESGDHYVVTGIQMPDEFIAEASKKMLIAACGWLDRRDHMRYTYLPKIDHVYMARQHENPGTGEQSYHDTFRAGMRLQIEDTDLGIERYDGNGNTAPFIDILTIKENGDQDVPTYDVVLRDEKEKGALEKIAETIEDLKKDTESMMERQKHPTRDRTYDEWDPNGLYYFQTLNPEPDPVTGIVYIETSYVWHNGKLWMCLRTLTEEEPKFGCHDWKCMMVGGIDEYEMRFLDANDVPYSDIIQTKPGYVNLYVAPIVKWGSEDITEMADSWEWHKYYFDEEADPSELNSSGMVEDKGWAMTHKERIITLTDEDMPTAWGRLNPVVFECVATFDDVEVEVARTVGFA